MYPVPPAMLELPLPPLLPIFTQIGAEVAKLALEGVERIFAFLWGRIPVTIVGEVRFAIR